MMGHMKMNFSKKCMFRKKRKKRAVTEEMLQGRDSERATGYLKISHELCRRSIARKRKFDVEPSEKFVSVIQE